MGMDVVGLDPMNKTGEYFRNNVWYWHPLWDFCDEIAADLIEDVDGTGHTNSGFVVPDFKALDLGTRLKNALEDGTAKKWMDERNEYLASLPRKVCQWCDGTGIRTDEVGVSHGMVTKALEPEIAILVGREVGYCNGCRGEGMVDDFAMNYSFDLDNVREFANFCINSGGFEIW